MATTHSASEVARFEELVRTESRGLYSLAYSILGDKQEAEDAVQDTMELAWKSWNSLRDPERRPVWIKRICLHRCLRVRHRPLGRFFISERDPDPRPPASQDLDMDRVFRKLSPHQRAIVALHFYYGHSLDESAALMGCRPGTARSHLARALACFRKELADD